MGKTKKILPIMLAGIAILIVAMAGLSYQVVQAQDSTPTPEPGAGVPPRGDGWKDGFKGEIRGGVSDEELASALGISVDELNEAEQAAAQAAIDQAVSEGIITQEQADRLPERGFGFGFGPHLRWLEESGIDYEALLAGELGITAEELESARQSAFESALGSAVEEGRITQEQADLILGWQALSNDEGFQGSMQSAFEEAVRQAVEDGVITQGQAYQILENSQGMGFGKGWFGGPGGMGRHGFGRGGMFKGEPPDGTTPPDAPESSGTF